MKDIYIYIYYIYILYILNIYIYIYIYLNSIMHCIPPRYLNTAQKRANRVFF